MASRTFKERIRAREFLAGVFVKTACHQTVEILGASELDFMVIDAEHAPFDRATLDVIALAARAANKPALVRLPESNPREILDVLDVGYSGILAPHARTREGVQQLAQACLYRGGTRGFSNSPRSGSYGAIGMKQHIEQSDRETAIVCQIEDRDAVDRVAELVSVEEVDCFLIGRADLAVSYEVFDTLHAEVIQAVEKTVSACVAAGKAVGIFVADVSEIPAYVAAGVSLFIVGSDQSMLRAQASTLARRIAEIRAN
ncbi:MULTISPECIES: HpcH/HpaI aldolase family protein [Paraburkholderia]|jgi:2-keto-3-deoxy-L-rhamnonate aldolase RhmA|uniref:HpcH/HpaI aldolase family protein n=1 Tax=Paraburkholderia TaxID=1822464 RepID=UPI00054CFC2C|nr:aldolase [Burkholderia sp. HB1]KFX64024.1 aldolase [Burkholderia sp. K24]OWJ56152.1 aldolase [Burkholderia sp. Bk]